MYFSRGQQPSNDRHQVKIGGKEVSAFMAIG